MLGGAVLDIDDSDDTVQGHILGKRCGASRALGPGGRKRWTTNHASSDKIAFNAPQRAIEDGCLHPAGPNLEEPASPLSGHPTETQEPPNTINNNLSAELSSTEESEQCQTQPLKMIQTPRPRRYET